jgi:hypothetical protein
MNRHLKLKKQKWVLAHRHPKLEKYDILIDLADIHHCSRKMYETGKISNKVLKKWKVRSRKNTSYHRNCPHVWLPQTVFWTTKWSTLNNGWKCLKCRCWRSGLDKEDLPESFRQEPYLSRCKNA